ncbi:MAG: alanyl-tRNA synthetase [Benjaminiella poitrasii]|nr:MAG: alanyl-tRNA synthetase [Benjaminiella poitrasii]
MYQTRHLSRKWLTESSRLVHARFCNNCHLQSHTPVKSSSLVPHNDKSLLFTNAGMVPFKEYFLKPNTAPFQCATSVQKCMRAGGKHNDLDNVGYTPRHHTFFEMLGNFSFGKYTKAEAIQYAWKFLLEKLELPIDRLRVTVLEGDQEAYELWKRQGLSDDMIIKCGPEDNFWSMGDGEGPCGSCTEIFWDTQDRSLEDPWLEIWNLVFMEKYRNAHGELTDLPIPCIDTGMGLERMTSVLQGKKNNFQIDQFQILVNGLRDVMKARGLESSTDIDPSPHEKIIADHFRAMCFLISDGVIPSNIGRGYVLRRIIRRALRSARQLNLNGTIHVTTFFLITSSTNLRLQTIDPFLTDLYPSLLAGFTDNLYPELVNRASSICSIIANEETSFLATLDRGMTVLENVFSQAELQKSKEIPSQVAFQLFDTYGFPFDLTLIIAKERGWSVDIEAVETLREKQKIAGRETWKSDSIADKSRLSEWRKMNIMPQFTGYEHSLLHQESTIVALDTAKKGKKIEVNVAIDPCPFYGLGGGQVPDKGTIELANGNSWEVQDVLQPYEGGLVLRISPTNVVAGQSIEQRIEEDYEYLQKGQLVRTEVDMRRRQGAEVHHTATHILNASLRKVLKTEDIVQAGSTVEPNKLRFDFTYGRPLNEEELNQIENWINHVALGGGKTTVKYMKLSDAVQSGAIAAFSEKYGETVRVVDVPGISKELCGGTHVDNVHKLYPFKILNETSVAAGTRRIEAVAGLACIEWYRKAFKPIPEVLKLLRANGTHEMVDKLEKSLQQNKELQKRVEFMNEKLASASEVVVKPISSRIEGVDVKIHLIDPDLDSAFMQRRANILKQNQPDSAHILINGNTIMIALNSAKIKSETANSLMKKLLKHIKGGGGGQKELAQGRLVARITTEKDIISTILPALEQS